MAELTSKPFKDIINSGFDPESAGTRSFKSGLLKALSQKGAAG
jgi:hypothetical protein